MAALVTLCAALTSTTFAEPPDAPSATRQKQQLAAAGNPTTSSAAQQRFTVVSTPNRLDRKYSIKTWQYGVAVAVMAAGTVADMETTVRGLERCKNGHEVNSWLYGRRPSRARLYGINIPIMAGVAWVAAKTKQDKKSGDFHAMWPVPMLITAGVHGMVAAHNANIRC